MRNISSHIPAPGSPSPWSATRYTSDDDFELESRHIFRRKWFCVGHASSVPKPGSFLRVELGGESVLVVRNRSGNLRAMLNLCRHRGAQLCTDEQGQFRRSIRCMYHGWTYDLDGRLTGLPWRKEMPPEMGNRDLYTVSAEEWLGYIWLNLDPHASSLTEYVAPQLRARFGDIFNPIPNYGLEELQLVHTINYDVAANWKLIWENFHECYHCPTMHPELCSAVPDFRDGYGTVTSPEALSQGLGAQLASGATGFSMSGRPVAPTLPGVPDKDRHTFYGFYIWPSVSVALVPDHAYFMRIHPVGANGTRVTADWLFHPDAARRPGFDPEDAIKVIDITNRQDFDACERMQKGASSRYYDDSQVFAPHEYLIADVRRRIDEAIADGIDAEMALPVYENAA